MARLTELHGEWTLSCTVPWENGNLCGPWRASVPGFVTDTLEAAGMLSPIRSPGETLSREWVSRRYWNYEKAFTLPEEPKEGRSERYYLHLRVAGRGRVFIDGLEAGSFETPWVETVLDITRHVEMGGEHRLKICIDAPPENECALSLAGILNASVRSCAFGRITFLRSRGKGNAIDVLLGMEGYTAGRVIFKYRVLLEDELISSMELDEKLTAATQEFSHSIPIEEPKQWNIAGCGEQPLYTVRMTVERGGTRCDNWEWKTAFPAFSQGVTPGTFGTLPYAIFNNGKQVFLYGAQCDPPVKEDALRSLARAGINLIRFGGALPPSDEIFSVCDELGILIWQELPFREMPHGDGPSKAAWSVAETLSRHPSAAYISGGRGLVWPDGSPVGILHPEIMKLREAALSACPWIEFLPASPSGPVREWGSHGRGLRHDTQGPLSLMTDFSEINGDDSILTAFGVPAPQFWQEDNWRLCEGAARFSYEALLGPFLEESKGEYLRLGRFMQNEWLRYMVGVTRGRFPSAAGMIWHRGNMPAPLAAAHALLDYNGAERPALGGMRRISQTAAAIAQLDKLFYYRGETITAKLNLLAESSFDTLYRIEVRLTDSRGNSMIEKSFQARGGSDVFGEISYRLEADAPETVLLWLQVFDGYMSVFRDTWTIAVPREGEPPFAPLRRLPKATPALSVTDDQLILTNDCPNALLGLTLFSGGRILYAGSMIPWEAREISADPSLIGSLRIEALNI